MKIRALLALCSLGLLGAAEIKLTAPLDYQVTQRSHRIEGRIAVAGLADDHQPGTRRPYGVLEWHAMLRLLDAESKNSGYPPYWH